VIQYPRIFRGYPTEKPVPVSEILVRQSTQSGECIVDPFMGSGSIGLAALQQNRDFLGNDICREAVEISQTRMNELLNPEITILNLI
jgi:site-specific DNA-methyltransferase (adenine-specific)